MLNLGNGTEAILRLPGVLNVEGLDAHPASGRLDVRRRWCRTASVARSRQLDQAKANIREPGRGTR